ncbi:endonuclease [Bacteroidota bacterium]
MKNLLPKRRASFLFALFLLISQFAFSQTPPSNLDGEELKAWFRTNYYDGKHQTLGYSTARMYLYNYIDNENNVITCVYSGYEVNSTYGGTTTYPAPINCEHTIPQSYFGEADPMVSDIHHLYPTYENWNSTRSNYPFAEIDDNTTTKWMYLNQSQTSIPTSSIDLYSEYASSTFEPREDHKGNVARSIFYFYTMYPTQAGNISQIGDINVFYQWHLDDPVDATEIERNGEVETYQGNRNPYIDYPETVALAWGFTPVNNPPVAPTLQLTEGETSLNLTWNNVSDENGYQLYKSISGSGYSLLIDLAANTTSYVDNSVSADITYSYYIIAYNDYGNSSNSNIVSGQLNSGNTGSGISVSEALAETIGTSVTVDGIITESFNGIYALIMKDINGSETIVVKLEADQRDEWSPENNPSVVGKTIEVVGVRDTYSSQPSIESVTSITEIGGTTEDTEAPTVPASLAYSNVSPTTVDLSWNASSDNVEVTGYNIYKGGVYYANTSNTNYTVSGLTASTAYSFYVKAKDAAGNISGASNIVNVTTSDIVLTYCVSQGNNSTYEWIAGVEIDTYSNSSGAANYTDFTSEIISLEKGSTVNISLTPGFNSSTYNEYWKIWIDYNADSDFDDSGELVFDAGSLSSAAVTGTITVPASANGSTRMRISMKYNAEQTACESFGYGEVEDYTVIFTDAVIDTESPSVPTSLAANNITSSSVALSWNASTDNVGVVEYEIYQDGLLIGNITNTGYSISGLSASTNYSFAVKAKDAAGNSSGLSNSINVTTNDVQISYCDSYGNNTSDEWIDQVIIAGLSNNSGNNNGYADFTNLTINVEANTSYDITFYTGYSGRSYKEVYSIWIDYNQDGTFNESTELVFSTDSRNTVVTGSFTVADYALAGETRMRVAMKYNKASAPCEVFTYGEVEDYTVNISSSKSSTIASKPEKSSLYNLKVKLFPNPAEGYTNIELISEESAVFEYQVIDLGGRVLLKEENILVNGYKEERIDVSNLKSGVYFVLISNPEFKETFKLIVK